MSTPAALKKNPDLRAVAKMSSIKIRAFHICPGSKACDAASGGYELSGNQVGKHFHFFLMDPQLPGR